MSLALQLTKLPAHFCGSIKVGDRWFKVQEYTPRRYTTLADTIKAARPYVTFVQGDSVSARIRRAFQRAFPLAPQRR